MSTKTAVASSYFGVRPLSLSTHLIFGLLVCLRTGMGDEHAKAR
jgi:hypothetical protein